MPSSPPDHGTPRPATEVLARLTRLAHEFAGSFRAATLVELMIRALDDLLAPTRIAVLLLDVDANRLALPFQRGPAVAADDPLLQLAFRAGPIVFPGNVRAAARAHAVDPVDPPAAWIGVPLVAVGRTIGAVSLGADRAGVWDDADLLAASAVTAQAAIALENARLVELLSIGKRDWEHTVDSITQAICIIDAHGAVRRANRAFAELIKVPVTALPGRPWLSLVPPGWAEVVARALARPGEPPVELKLGARTLLVGAFPMAVAGAAVLVCEDVTEKRRLQEQLIQSEKMSAMGQLIAGVAHDLNNPLASVVGFADFLSEAAEIPGALREPLQVIRQEAERAATIVHNLLSFARRQETRRERRPIQPLLESTVALLRNELLAHDVTVTVTVEPDTPDIELNANQIKQVFLNLLNNAVQALAGAGRPGQVRVHARPWLDGIAVSVRDDGPGMPPEIAGHVFEPFFTTKAEGQGTGLGLAICQGIVKEHGGRLTLETTPGGGATFSVELPGSAAPAPAPAEGAPAVLRTDGALRVLVVDDEEPILHYMRATLEAWGHAVTVARDGNEAFDHAAATPFDLIICDLRMPNAGGRDLYERLARSHPAAAERLVFATGDTVRGDTLQFLQQLGRPYLHKPFTLAELRRVLGGAAPP
jgi:two-component system NtrC family sensor kinase